MTKYTIYTGNFQHPITTREALKIKQNGITAEEVFSLVLEDAAENPRQVAQLDTLAEAQERGKNLRSESYIERTFHGIPQLSGELAYIEVAKYEFDGEEWEFVSGSDYIPLAVSGIEASPGED